MNNFSKILIISICIIASLLAGCQQQTTEPVVVDLAQGPGVDALIDMPAYASRIFEATGRLDTWVNTEQIDIDCVVTIYKPDSSFYLTEQTYTIYPWSNSIQLSAIEPAGKVLCRLSWPGFKVLEGSESSLSLPQQLNADFYAKMILGITTAPARFLDSSAVFTRGNQPVKIEGTWYYPIQRNETGISGQMRTSKVIYYQNKDSFRIDMIWFADADNKKFIAVRGYDYTEIEKNGVLIPAKIEIFKTDSTGVLQQRLVKIDAGI